MDGLLFLLPSEEVLSLMVYQVVVSRKDEVGVLLRPWMVDGDVIRDEILINKPSID